MIGTRVGPPDRKFSSIFISGEISSGEEESADGDESILHPVDSKKGLRVIPVDLSVLVDPPFRDNELFVRDGYG